MRTSVLLNLAVAVGLIFAQDTCMADSAWIGCVSTQRDAASAACASADTVPLSMAVSILASCGCNGFDINYSCAKTYCPGDTSLQSQLIDSYNSCTSFASNPNVVLTLTGEAPTSPITQTSSTAVPSASNIRIPTSTTTASATSTSSTTGTTSALGITASVATSQASSTTSASKAAANPVLASNGGLGGVLAFVAGMAALM